MTYTVATFKLRNNARLLALELWANGISGRVLSQGMGAIWNVYVWPEDGPAAVAVFQRMTFEQASA